MEIIKAKDMIGKAMHPKFFIIGHPGSGKTFALTTFPPEWKVLVLDMFGNKESLEGAENVEIISYSELDPSSAEAWMKIQQDKTRLVDMLSSGDFKWDVLALDTASGLIRFNENFILKAHPEKTGIGGAPAKHHYRGASHMIGQYITSFLGFPITVVVNCHALPDEDTGINTALMSGKRWRNTIYGYVGEVYRAFGDAIPAESEEDESTQYLWQTQQDFHWPMLKSTLNQKMEVFGKYIKPDYGKLLERRGIVRSVQNTDTPEEEK